MTALVIGPDRHGFSVVIVNGRVSLRVPPDAEFLPCPDGEIAPGAVNAHTHLYSGLAPYGIPPASPRPENFIQILERLWWRLDRALDGPSLAAAATDYIAHALLSGTTTLVDHHESPNLIPGSLGILADACERLGMRGLLCYGATERNFGRDEAQQGLDECRRVAPTALVRPLVGLHAGFTVSDDTIREAGSLARELGTVLHVHLAEDVADVEDARRRGHAGPLQRLEALDALPPGSILAHGVHLLASEVQRADRLGCWLVHNPRSNEGNGVGYAANLGASSRVALGTDGWPADMAAERAALERLATQNGDTMAAGRLEAGYRLIAERFAAPPQPLAPRALGDVVVRENGLVRHVVVNGRVVVRDGHLTGGDLTVINAHAHRQAGRLWMRMEQL
ncbi:MAG TPA: amidohydrolase family protein [Azospirillaceae bacterium]|nr:amidohydrolase family protein [Azospirillaceae bacterium]